MRPASSLEYRLDMRSIFQGVPFRHEDVLEFDSRNEIGLEPGIGDDFHVARDAVQRPQEDESDCGQRCS